jgi:hypothetical protein
MRIDVQEAYLEYEPEAGICSPYDSGIEVQGSHRECGSEFRIPEPAL